MALVAYDYSDSENEISDIEENSESENNTGIVLLPKTNTEESKEELFLKLPTPKGSIQTLIEEDDDEFLRKTAVKPVPKQKNTVKISIPSLSDFAENDTDEVPRKILKKSAASLASTGLFSVLPPPKSVKMPTTKFVPNSVAKKPIQISKPVKPIETPNKNEDFDSNEDGLPSSDSFFFTSIFDNNVETKPPQGSINPTINVDCARNVQEADLKTNRYFADMVKNTAQATIELEPEEGSSTSAETDLVKDAYTQLVGKSRKAKGKGNKVHELDIIDINATDIMPDSREWMTKSLTEEKPVVVAKKGEEPSMQQRRKHQITYLAYQAKVNEQDLKNQWSLNRMSRKQTQAKYGF